MYTHQVIRSAGVAEENMVGVVGFLQNAMQRIDAGSDDGKQLLSRLEQLHKVGKESLEHISKIEVELIFLQGYIETFMPKD
jgi:hypothetical protein